MQFGHRYPKSVQENQDVADIVTQSQSIITSVGPQLVQLIHIQYVPFTSLTSDRFPTLTSDRFQLNKDKISRKLIHAYNRGERVKRQMATDKEQGRGMIR